MTNKKSTIVLPPSKARQIKQTSTQTIIPASELLVHDAKSIIAAELARYRLQVSNGKQLDLKEARVVQGYLETLIKLSREEREAARQEDLSNLSNEELLELAAKVLNAEKPRVVKEPE